MDNLPLENTPTAPLKNPNTPPVKNPPTMLITVPKSPPKKLFLAALAFASPIASAMYLYSLSCIPKLYF